MNKNSLKKSVKNTPADPTLPKVALVIDDETYHLVWDFNALATAEAISGQNLLSALSFDGITALQLRGLLFGALLKLQPEITLNEAGSLLRNEPTTLIIIDKLVEAYHGSMPEPDSGDKLPNVKTPESN